MLVDHHFIIFFPFKSIQQRAPYKKEGVALGLPFPIFFASKMILLADCNPQLREDLGWVETTLLLPFLA